MRLAALVGIVSVVPDNHRNTVLRGLHACILSPTLTGFGIVLAGGAGLTENNRDALFKEHLLKVDIHLINGAGIRRIGRIEILLVVAQTEIIRRIAMYGNHQILGNLSVPGRKVDGIQNC